MLEFAQPSPIAIASLAALKPSLQFFSIELMPMADGRTFVSATATLCEAEGELLHMELVSESAASIEAAVALLLRAIDRFN